MPIERSKLNRLLAGFVGAPLAVGAFALAAKTFALAASGTFVLAETIRPGCSRSNRSGCNKHNPFWLQQQG